MVNKQQLQEQWKNHKLSNILLASVLIQVSIFLYSGAIILRDKIELPNYLLSALIVFVVAWMMFDFQIKNMDKIVKKEEQKEKP